MMPNKTSLILDDKNERHDLISRVIALIVDEFDCRFQITHLTNLDAFTPAEKEYLISVFAPDITSLYIWQYSFAAMKISGSSSPLLLATTTPHSNRYSCYSTIAPFLSGTLSIRTIP